MYFSGWLKGSVKELLFIFLIALSLCLTDIKCKYFLLGLSGFLPIHPMTYIDAKRNRKKAEEKAKLDAEAEEGEQEAVAQ